jgi:hypothetical protein
MWNAIWKTRSSTINKKEVQILLKIVDDQKTIPKHRLREKRKHVPVVQLHTYTLATTNCRRNLVRVFDSWNVICPGISMSKRWTCIHEKFHCCDIKNQERNTLGIIMFSVEETKCTRRKLTNQMF